MGHVINDKMLWPDDEPYPNGNEWIWRIVTYRESKGTQYVQEVYSTEEAALAAMDRLLAWSPGGAGREHQWGYQLQKRPNPDWVVVEYTPPTVHVDCVRQCHVEENGGTKCAEGVCSWRALLENSIEDGMRF